MAFPIRFKIIDRETGEVVKGVKEDGTPICALLLPSGQIAKMTQDFYTYVHELSPHHYELHVALTKDEKGNWQYQKIGY